VRDTAQLLGKKVHLHLQGEETELDKTVLESISDPLVHLIRNAVDHGIESAAKRREAGKSEEGNVRLSAFHESGKLVIEIRDDGGGINGAVLLAKAKEKGVIPANAVLSEKECVHLIFHPGFSTKQEVSEVSGRGVGMDVVRTNIEMLQGEIQIQTEVGKGTTFRVILPLTLAIIDGMVVRCGEERFVIPLSQVHESVRPATADVQFNVGVGEVLLLRGECLPMLRLGLVLGRKAARDVTDSIAIVIRASGKPYAIIVDDIVGQYQIVIKKLGQELSRLKVFSGSAVLGDGRPAFILDPPELAKIATPISSGQRNPVKPAERMAS
jgi:two-component system chemotaxis sensor kinase CheA